MFHTNKNQKIREFWDFCVVFSMQKVDVCSEGALVLHTVTSCVFMTVFHETTLY